MRKSGPDRRMLLYGGLVIVCLLVTVGYAVRARLLSQAPVPSAAGTVADPQVLASILAQPHLFFLDAASAEAARQLAVVPLDAVAGERYLTPLYCRRIAFGGGEGLCMGGGPTAWTFDKQFRVSASFQQPGIPTRSRVAATGDLGSMTWFVAGHSYADASFSTQTLLVNPRNGQTLSDLEQFSITRDGARFQAVDFNFWGVTFAAADPNRFYATLSTGGSTYLIEGDVAQRQARVLRDNVECPSLSPDGTHLVFKKRVDPSNPNAWRLAILDLPSLEERWVPGEDRSIDDQVEWLDDNHFMYALQVDGPPDTSPDNIWVASLDGTDEPHVLLSGAMSPILDRN